MFAFEKSAVIRHIAQLYDTITSQVRWPQNGSTLFVYKWCLNYLAIRVSLFPFWWWP